MVSFTNCSQAGQNGAADEKLGIPTMGGLLIIGAIDLTALLWAQWTAQVTLTLLSMLVLCLLGFYDDWSKITRQDAAGVTGQVKLAVQFALAGFIAVYLWRLPETRALITEVMGPFLTEPVLASDPAYAALTLAAVVGMVITVLAIVGSSNAVNLTDGMDGLAIGSTVIVAVPN